MSVPFVNQWDVLGRAYLLLAETKQCMCVCVCIHTCLYVKYHLTLFWIGFNVIMPLLTFSNLWCFFHYYLNRLEDLSVSSFAMLVLFTLFVWGGNIWFIESPKGVWGFFSIPFCMSWVIFIFMRAIVA